MSLLKIFYSCITYLYLAPFALGGIIVGFLNSKTSLSKWSLDENLSLSIRTNLLLITVLAIVYLLYPSYLDHLESTVATLGLIYSNGGQIYPEISNYTFHGLLYGPGLSEIQSSLKFLGLPIILSSKIPGVLSFLLSIIILRSTIKNDFSKAYLIFLVPFGLFLFWNRAEPFLLLIVSLCLWILFRSTNLGAVFLIGCLAGFASSLKLHGALYVLAAIFVAFPHNKINLKTVFCLSIGALLAAFLTFMPEQISILNYLKYIELASKHGLSIVMLLENFTYLLALVLPIIYLGIKYTSIRKEFIHTITILVIIECITATISSKPGSGIHHLIPFIPINAFLLQRIFESCYFNRSSIRPFKLGLMAVSLATCIPLLQLSWQMTSKFKIQSESRVEVEKISDEFSGLILGVSDTDNYIFTFFRPLLEAKGNKQIDFPAFMDLNYSGISDAPFLRKIQDCDFPYVALPASGKPFSMNTFYIDRPLISDEVRLAFEKNYKIISYRKFYTIYSCKKTFLE
jgi:hypothetical protein